LSHQPAAACSPIPARAGIGLRFQHHQAVIEDKPQVAWLEVHTENYMGCGAPLRDLDVIRREYPISLHGVGLSLGSVERLDLGHLACVRRVAERVEPALVSEHLSWSRILVENPSTYLRFRHSTIAEWEFLAAVAARTGCGILCDVNNIYVSAANHGWHASDYLTALPSSAVGEIHLAGHSIRELDGGRVLRIDDHGSRVIPEVWQLYSEALSLFGPVPTLIEWDTDVPPLDTLLDEAARAEALLRGAPESVARADAA